MLRHIFPKFRREHTLLPTICPKFRILKCVAHKVYHIIQFNSSVINKIKSLYSFCMENTKPFQSDSFRLRLCTYGEKSIIAL